MRRVLSMSVFMIAAFSSTASTMYDDANPRSVAAVTQFVPPAIVDRDFTRPALPLTEVTDGAPSPVDYVTPDAVYKPHPAVSTPTVVPTSSAKPVERIVKRIAQVVLPKAVAVGVVQGYALTTLGTTQYGCLAAIIHDENPGWITTRYNQGGSGAYGIPQALPGSKMAVVGVDWRTNGITQIKWMIIYVKLRYGSACSAWDYWKVHYSY